MTKPNAVKPLDASPFPGPSPQPATPEQPVAGAEPAPFPRVARGRGEPRRPAAAPRPSRSASVPSRPAVPPTPPPPPAPANELAWGDLASERDDSGYAAASRLAGLRNLLVSLGRRSLNNTGEPAGESNCDLEPRFERATPRTGYPDTPLPAADAEDNGAPTRLTAQPEFLPPKPVVEGEKEKEAVRPTALRRDYPENDDIQTLPSWRGQYRKKRYPPM